MEDYDQYDLQLIATFDWESPAAPMRRQVTQKVQLPKPSHHVPIDGGRETEATRTILGKMEN